MRGQYTTFLRVCCFVLLYGCQQIFTAGYNVALKILTQQYFGRVARALVYLQLYAETEVLVKKIQNFPLATKSGMYEALWFCWFFVVFFFSLYVLFCYSQMFPTRAQVVFPGSQYWGQFCLIFLTMTWTKGPSVPSGSLQKTPSCFLQLSERTQIVDVSLFSQITNNKSMVNGLKLFQE